MSPQLIHRSPDVYLLIMPLPTAGITTTNCYIIREGQDTLVIDTGAPTGEAKNILMDALQELDVDMTKVRFFLTHFHLDHAGLADQIVSPEIPLYVSEREYQRTRKEACVDNAQNLRQLFVENGASEEEANSILQMRSAESDYVGEDHNFIFVNEGDTISLGQYDFEVIDTSGHTPGQIALFEPRSGILFSGDHILYFISPVIDFFSKNEDGLARYLSNLEKVKNLPVTRLLHSHGEIKDDYEERADALINHQKKRLEETLRIIEQTPHQRGVDIIKQIKWNVPADSWDEIFIMQRSLVVGQGLVLLKHLVMQEEILASRDEKGIYRFQRA